MDMGLILLTVIQYFTKNTHGALCISACFRHWNLAYFWAHMSVILLLSSIQGWIVWHLWYLAGFFQCPWASWHLPWFCEFAGHMIFIPQWPQTTVWPAVSTQRELPSCQPLIECPGHTHHPPHQSHGFPQHSPPPFPAPLLSKSRSAGRYCNSKLP